MGGFWAEPEGGDLIQLLLRANLEASLTDN